jgi:iron complex transport system ATP-binding protein
VTLVGRGLGACSALERARRIAFVPQSEPTHFEFAVRDVVLMGRYPHRPRGGLTTEDFDLAALVMEETDILHLAERSITELSGGEHRRVLLARALIQDAPLLLLDEPTAHLDIAHQAELMEQVRRRVREGRGALAALHDLNQAAEFCDRLVLMQQGKLLADGAPEEVLTRENLRIAYQVEAEIGVNPATGRPMTLYVTPIRRS